MVGLNDVINVRDKGGQKKSQAVFSSQVGTERYNGSGRP